MKNLFNIKLKAGGLQYTIFISVVIALLIFGFIGLTFVQQKLRLKNMVFKELVHQNEIAFQSLNSGNKNLTAEEDIRTIVSKKQWGIFDVASITSKKGYEVHTKTAFVGGFSNNKPALYLQEENQPLVVVGTTRIEGTALLPEQGVKQGSITGHSYTNNQLVYGTIQNSSPQLPKAANLERIKRFKDSVSVGIDFELLDLLTEVEIVNPFTNETLLFRSAKGIELRDIRLIGNCIITSDTKIIIHESAKLVDAVIIAPEIVINRGVTGSFQAFADNKLLVNENVQLSYPTCLIVTEKKQITNQQHNNQKDINQLVIGKNTNVKGIIGFLTENKESSYKTQLIIEEGTEVVGEVYCQQNLELKGTVKGSVYTKGFISNQFGAVYANHIYNGQIISSKLPQQYVGLNFKDSKQKVAKWLYY